jgi:hypothetical protein
MDKINWSTVITAAVVAVIVSLITVSINGGVLFSPQLANNVAPMAGSVGGGINANLPVPLSLWSGSYIGFGTGGSSSANARIDENGDLLLMNLQENGNADLCIDNFGKVFRNATACV